MLHIKDGGNIINFVWCINNQDKWYFKRVKKPMWILSVSVRFLNQGWYIKHIFIFKTTCLKKEVVRNGQRIPSVYHFFVNSPVTWWLKPTYIYSPSRTTTQNHLTICSMWFKVYFMKNSLYAKSVLCGWTTWCLSYLILPKKDYD